MKQKTQIIAIVLYLLSTQIGISQTTSGQLKLADSLFSLEEQPNGAGLAISITQKGEPLYKNQSGFANLEHMVPITDTTVFLVGSISKQFTAFSILLLEAKGLLSVEDEATKYLPELKALGKSITIRQLASHTSGFRNTDDLYNMRGKDEGATITQEEVISFLLRQKGLNFEPGEKFQYCNAGYVLMTEIVERVSGKSFSEFAKEQIFEPLGMTRTQFVEDPSAVIKNNADSYKRVGEENYYIPMNRTIVGSTGLHTTANDLNIWAMNYHNPKVGNANIIQKMLTKNILNSGNSTPYGLGIETKQCKGLDVVFHGGGDAGFRAYFLWVPKYQLSIVVTGNYESFNPLNLAYGMIDVFLANQIVESTKKKMPIYSDSELEKWVGDYQVFPGFYITILAEDGKLYFQPYGTDQPLELPTLPTKNEFLFPHRPHSKIVFSEKGLRWHFSDFSYPGKRVSVDPPKYQDLEINQYLGEFYSEELETTYTFTEKDGKILAQHVSNPDVILNPIAQDAFISAYTFLGRVEFVRDAKGLVIGCKVSGQSADGVWFERR